LDKKELDKILDDHEKNVAGDENYKSAELFNMYMNNIDISGRNTSHINFQRSILLGSNFSNAKLRSTTFNSCFLVNCDFTDTDLTGSSLIHANLFGAKMDGCNLDGVALQGTIGNLHQVKSMHIDKYPVTYTTKYVQVGHWRLTMMLANDLSRDDIALNKGSFDFEWWDDWKDTILAIIKKSPAEV
jgi:hypothetical protein